MGISGLSFAIPIDSAIAVIDQLRKNKIVERAILGLMMVDVFRGRGGFRDRNDTERFVRVKSVERNSPAHKAGIQANDILLQLDSRAIKSIKDIYKVSFSFH